MGFCLFTLTLRCRFLSLFMTDSVSYLHNNALIRKATNWSVSGGSTPTAENQMPVSHMSAVKKTKTGNKTHPRPPAPLCCQSCSCMCFVFSTGRDAWASGAVHQCCLWGADTYHDKVWRFYALLRMVHISRLNFFFQDQSILKSRMDTWNKNESQNAPNVNKKEVIHRQEKQRLGVIT